MGYVPWRHRLQRGSELMWFDMEDIIAGRNRAWKKWVQRHPSLKTVEIECISFYRTKMKIFRQRYGVPDNEITNFFKLWIGYNPKFGAYLASVGPYVYNEKPTKTLKKRENLRKLDKENRFQYFTKRYQYASEAQVNKAYEDFLSKSLGPYSEAFDKGDFNFSFRKATGFKQDGSIQWEEATVNMNDPLINVVTDSSNPNKAQMFLGAGSQININSRGMAKLINTMTEKENCPEMLTQAIMAVANRNKISPESIQQMLVDGQGEESLGILKEVFDDLQHFFPIIIKKQARENGWEDILKLAVERTSGMVVEDLSGRGVKLTQEGIWEFLNKGISGDENSPMLAQISYPNQKAADTANKLRDKIINEIVGNINTIKNNIIKQNEINSSDPPEVAKAKQELLDKVARIKPMTTNRDLGKATSFQQHPGEVKPTPAYERLLRLKKEILEYMAGKDLNSIDVNEISATMTAKRSKSKSKAKGKEWKKEEVERWVSNIAEDLNQPSLDGQPNTIETLLEKTNSDLNMLRDTLVMGTSRTIEQALGFMNLTFNSASYEEIDPKTGVPKTIDVNALTPLFQRNIGAPDVTADQLTELRNKAASFAPVEQVEPKVDEDETATQSDIETQVGETPVMEPSTQPAQTAPVEEPSPSVQPQTSTPTDTTDELSPEEIDKIEQQNMGKFLKNTLNTLIKIAAELDYEGKTTAAEEIHLIIRKYLG